MMRTIRVALLLAGLMAAGCVTRADYAKNVNSYVGRSIDEVVLGMGPPDSSFQLADGRWVFEWEEVTIDRRLSPDWGHTSYVETSDGRIVPVHRPSPFGSEVNEITRICTTRFMTGVERIVQSVGFEGDGCRA